MSPAKTVEAQPSAVAHPLDPPTAQEIVAATTVLRTHLQGKGIKAFKFTTVMLKEPPKAQVIAALKYPGGYPNAAQGGAAPERQVEVHLIDMISGTAYEAFVVLGAGTKGATIKSFESLPEGVQPGLTVEELCMAEEIIRKDPRVVKAAADIGLKPEQLCADGWSIGWDRRWEGRRLQQCLMYARFNKDENLYAHPLDFMPIMDNNTGEVLAIDYPAHRVGKNGALSSESTAAPTEASFEAPSSRARIPPPLAHYDFLPDLATTIPQEAGAANGTTEAKQGRKIESRKDIKPLSVVQPEGVSFVRKGNQLEWQKWKLHVGFHPREGIVLSTISYADTDAPGASAAAPQERPLFYRLSLAEMVVPYGAPEHPHYRKFAFDVGEYGLGYLANPLKLGCDCLGSIEYLDGEFVKHDGSVEVVENAICIHEEDTGLLWKHSDYRAGGRAHAVRGRKLVVSMVCTVANYEYAIYWNFHMDGNIELEVKLTGILNLYVLGQGEEPSGFGTQVAPRINAHYHQHLFSVRLDPHIDGPLNSVQETTIQALPYPTGSAENFAGNGFNTNIKTLKTTGEAVRDANPSEERSWTFVNAEKKHYSSGKPVGYKIMCKDLPPLYAKPDSFVATRAPFSKHHFWTVPYDDEQRYPAGKHVPQTTSTPADSIESWVGDGSKDIEQKDIVSFLTFGTTHIPRPEDFPVMPAETVRMMLKPVSFFARNPALDVPSVKDAKSIHAEAAVGANGTNGTNGANGAACCSA